MKTKTQTETTNLKVDFSHHKLIYFVNYPQDMFNHKSVDQTGMISHWFYPG